MAERAGRSQARLTRLQSRSLLLALVGCLVPGCGKPNDAPEISARSLSLLDEPTPPEMGAEAAGKPPVRLGWDDFPEDAEVLSTMTLRIKNHQASSETVELAVIAYGLDFRTVERPLAIVTVAANAETTQTVTLADLPIQGVSYSSLAFVSATFDRGGADLVVLSPDFFYHFPPDYSHPTVYNEDTLVQDYTGGRLTCDAFELIGRVWTGGTTFQEINDLRDQEWDPSGSVPAPPSGGPILLMEDGNYDGDHCFDFPPGLLEEPRGVPGIPSQDVGDAWEVLPLKVCVDWKTKYFDVGNEDIANTPKTQTMDASFARVTLHEVVFDPCLGTPGVDNGCHVEVVDTWLNHVGCFEPPPLEHGTKYLVTVYSEMKKPAGATARIDKFTNPSSGPKVNQGVAGTQMSFVYDEEGLHPVHLTTPPYVINNASGAMSRLMSRPDLGIVDNGLVDPDFEVQANMPCGDLGSCNSYTGGKWVIRIAPEHTWDANGDAWGLGDMVWKFIIAHEYGHTVQRNLFGMPYPPQELWCGDPGESPTPYKFPDGDGGCGHDPPGIGPMCACAHIPDQGLRWHCMQSQERFEIAANEGFAHFIAARTWNIPYSTNCDFTYYKDFRFASGVEAPPVYLDCKTPHQWRDTHCHQPSLGTPYDWLQFYWNVNAQTANRSTMTDLGHIYLHACGADAIDKCGLKSISWQHVKNAAVLYYGADPAEAHAEYFIITGRNTGSPQGLVGAREEVRWSQV